MAQTERPDLTGGMATEEWTDQNTHGRGDLWKGQGSAEGTAGAVEGTSQEGVTMPEGATWEKCRMCLGNWLLDSGRS